jgi:hypothetical protein
MEDASDRHKMMTSFMRDNNSDDIDNTLHDPLDNIIKERVTFQFSK